MRLLCASLLALALLGCDASGIGSISGNLAAPGGSLPPGIGDGSALPLRILSAIAVRRPSDEGGSASGGLRSGGGSAVVPGPGSGVQVPPAGHPSGGPKIYISADEGRGTIIEGRQMVLNFPFDLLHEGALITPGLARDGHQFSLFVPMGPEGGYEDDFSWEAVDGRLRVTDVHTSPSGQTSFALETVGVILEQRARSGRPPAQVALDLRIEVDALENRLR